MTPPRPGSRWKRRGTSRRSVGSVSIPRLVEHAGLDDVRIDEASPSGALST